MFELNRLQQIQSDYIDKKPWMQVNKPSIQVRHFERRLSKSSLILDMGCGSGMDTMYLRECGHNVIAIDLDSDCANINCDVVGMPFNDKCFDAVFCRGVLHLCSDIDKAFSEMIRVSKFGSILFLSYCLNITDDNNEMPLGKRLSYSGKTKLLYERVSRKNHISHSHTFYVGILRNVIH